MKTMLNKIKKLMGFDNEILCHTTTEWIHKLADAHQSANTVKMSNNPIKRLIGFRVGNTIVSVPVKIVKQKGWENSEGQIALNRINFKTNDFSRSIVAPKSRYDLICFLKKNRKITL